MPQIESRWPLLAKPAELQKVTGTLKGKIPTSLHAQADMLDGAAQTAAREAGRVIVAVAGEAYPGEVDEKYEEPVTKEVEVPDPDNPKKTVKALRTTAVERTRKVPTLSRDYWAI